MPHPSLLFFYLGTAFLVGVLLASFATFPDFLPLLVSIASVGVAVALKTRARTGNILVVFFSLATLAAGFGYYHLRFVRFEPSALAELSQSGKPMHVEVISEPKTGEYYQTFIAREEIRGLKIRTRIPVSETIAIGDRFSVVAPLEPLAEPRYLSRGIYFQMNLNPHAKSQTSVVKNLPPRRSLRRTLHQFKQTLQAKVDALLPSDEASFLSGILYGAQTQSKELKEQMRRTGTLHLTAMSGYNITLVASYVGRFLAAFLPFALQLPTSLLAIALFVLFVGAEASVVRAGIMGAAILLIKHSGRLPLSRNIILGAALLMVLSDPTILRFDLGFQLSFLATLGIVYLAPRAQEFFSKLMNSGQPRQTGAGVLAETLSAQLMVTPLLLAQFGNLALAGIAANLLIVPLTSLFMLLGFLLLAALVAEPLAKLIALPLTLFLQYPLSVFSLLSPYGFLTFRLPATVIGACYLVLFLTIYRLNRHDLPDFRFADR